MDFSHTRKPAGGHALGFGIAAVLHLLLGYALVTGLAKKVVEVIRAPIETKVIEELRKPPPPLEMAVPPPPRLDAPPPPFIPPPEVQLATPVPPPQAPVTLAPSVAPPVAEAVPTPPVAVPAAPTVAAPPVVVAIGVACPTMVAPVMPERAVRDEIAGSVSARATVRGGKVVAVEILKSQPRGVFDGAVRTAMLQYRCQSTGDQTVQAVQEFVFRNE